jgi:hypothetical protein
VKKQDRQNSALWEAQRVFTARGHVTHLIPSYGSPNDAGQPAFCGLSPGWGAWYGTGSWEESQRAKELPTCINCERTRRRPE